MTRKVFTKIIDELAEIDFTGRVSLYLMNDPFLDKRIYDLIAEAHNKLPNARINLSTNGVIPSREDMDKAFLHGLSDADISCYSQPILDKWKGYKANVMNFIEDCSMFYNRGGNVPEYGRDCNLGVGYCERPSIQMYINAFGEAVLCCSDYKREVVLGNVGKDKLIDIWNNNLYKEYREHLNQGKRDLPLCKKCNYA